MKRILSIILVVVLSTSLLVFATATGTNTTISFTDVDQTTVSGQAIYKLAEAGILVGDGDGTFRPNDPITRAELSKIVNAIFGYSQKAETGFVDLTGNEWFYSHVLIAKQAGYIVGYDDGTFKADNHVTREQACAILCRTASLYDLSFNVEITDPVSEWAKPYVQKVLANSMMFLEEGNTFRAAQNITRAEFSAVFANFLITESATATPSPTPTPTKKPSIGNIGGGGNGGNGGNSGNSGSQSTAKPTATASPTATATPTAKPTTEPTASPTVTPTTTPEPDYAEVNKEMLENLKAVSDDIDTNLYSFPVGNCRNIITKIKACIDDTILQGDSNVIDANFVRTEYETEIDEAKAIYDEIMADEDQKAAFQEGLAYLNSATLNWLAKEFGLID